jgi:hypothetical protein
LREQTQAAAQLLRIELNIVEARAPTEFESAFAAVTTGRADALVVMPDSMFYGQHQQIVGFAAASRMPALFTRAAEIGVTPPSARVSAKDRISPSMTIGHDGSSPQNRPSPKAATDLIRLRVDR